MGRRYRRGRGGRHRGAALARHASGDLSADRRRADAAFRRRRAAARGGRAHRGGAARQRRRPAVPRRGRCCALPAAWQPQRKLRTPFDYAVAALRALDLPAARAAGAAGGDAPARPALADRAAARRLGRHRKPTGATASCCCGAPTGRSRSPAAPARATRWRPPRQRSARCWRRRRRRRCAAPARGGRRWRCCWPRRSSSGDDAMRLTRRAALLGLGSAMALGRASLALAAAPTERRFVVVLLRGGLDGLAVVVPHGDRDLAALARAAGAGGAARPRRVLRVAPGAGGVAPHVCGGRGAGGAGGGRPGPQPQPFRRPGRAGTRRLRPRHRRRLAQPRRRRVARRRRWRSAPACRCCCAARRGWTVSCRRAARTRRPTIIRRCWRCTATTPADRPGDGAGAAGARVFRGGAGRHRPAARLAARSRRWPRRPGNCWPRRTGRASPRWNSAAGTRMSARRPAWPRR